MLRRTALIDQSEEGVVNFILHKVKETEAISPYSAKAWIICGKTMVANSLPLYMEAYQLEKRIKNVTETGHAFEQLFRMFGSQFKEDIVEMTNAVRICTLSKGKETLDQQFLNNVFQTLSKETRIEILIKSAEFTPVLFEKCQAMLLMVKLFPETINHKNGAEMLFALLSCESEIHSTFRKLLVVELVPSVLQLSQNLTASPRFLALLNQCIEYYVLVAKKQDTLSDNRWDKLFQIVDQIGGVLKWTIAPFFRGVAGTNSVETLLHAVESAIEDRNRYSTTELAYVTVVVFLRCIVSNYELLRNCSTFGGKKLILVEVFTPKPDKNAKVDPDLPVLTSVSNCSSIGGKQSQIKQHFLAGVKIWEMVTSLKGIDNLEKEFFEILYSLNLNLSNWKVFKDFQLDYHTYLGTYVGQHDSEQEDVDNQPNPLKLASMHCSFNNFKSAAEFCIKAVSEAIEAIKKEEEGDGSSPDKGPFSNFGYANKEDFNFYSRQVYDSDDNEDFIFQRRVHFLSYTNPAEVLAYAANILIRCFYESLDADESTLEKDDRFLGHLLTLLQLEWPSPPAVQIFNRVLEAIKQNGSFRYVPFFSDFILEPDFLETFMFMFNHATINVELELFPNAEASSSGHRTRGAEKEAKTELMEFMQRQMKKNGRENLGNLISKFLTLNKEEILAYFQN